MDHVVFGLVHIIMCSIPRLSLSTPSFEAPSICLLYDFYEKCDPDIWIPMFCDVPCDFCSQYFTDILSDAQPSDTLVMIYLWTSI